MVRDLPSEIAATLTALGATPVSAQVIVTSVESAHLTLANSPALPLLTPVKIVLGDRLWLGQVETCRANGVSVIAISHTLSNLSELLLLAGRFTGKIPASSAEPGVPTLS
jgi:hypothetical protein